MVYLEYLRETWSLESGVYLKDFLLGVFYFGVFRLGVWNLGVYLESDYLEFSTWSISGRLGVWNLEFRLGVDLELNNITSPHHLCGLFCVSHER